MSYLLPLLLLLLGLMVWQQWRHLRNRRDSAGDAQHLLHGRDTFHVMTYFQVPEGGKVLDSARGLYAALRDAGNPRLVHAGHAGFTQNARQLGEHHWDGVMLLEYPSRAAYESEAATAHARNARELFRDSYIHGMRRRRRASLFLPQRLLFTRILDTLRGRWHPPALEKVPAFDTGPEFELWRARISRLDALHTINPTGLVVYNLIKHGDSEQRAADRGYSRRMLSRMAALGHGPLHLGRSVTLEGDARFDTVAIVHFPSARYYAELLASRFFQDIIGDKQLADTLVVPTVPITALID